MKSMTCILILLCLLSVRADEYLVFVDNKGREIAAKIIRADSSGEKVTLQRRGQRKSITVPVAVFNAETQASIISWIQNSDFLNERIFSIELDKQKKKLKDESKSYDMGSYEGTTSLVYFGHKINIDIHNKTTHTYNDVILEYILYYTQEEIIKNADYTKDNDKEIRSGSLFKREIFSIPSKTRKVIETEEIFLKNYSSNQASDPKIEGELEGAIIRITVSPESGNAVTREIIYPEKLKYSWTTETKDVQPHRP